MLLHVLSTLVLATLFSQITGNVNVDHDITLKNGEYEFFFHHNNNLLLVVRPDKCFFSSLDKDAHLEMLLQNPTELQARFMDDVHNERNQMRTDLLTVRNRFMDLRADYHCLDKRIFIMEAEPVLMNSTPQTAQPTQPTQPAKPTQPAQPKQHAQPAKRNDDSDSSSSSSSSSEDDD